MTIHPSAETRARYFQGLLSADAFLAVDDHLAGCAQCRAEMSPPPRSVEASILDAIVGDHLRYEEIEAYVDRTLPAQDDAVILAHLERCPMCAGEVRDLRLASGRTAEHPSLEDEIAARHEDVEDVRRMAAVLTRERRTARWPYIVAVAAVVAAILITALLMRKTATSVPPRPVPQIATSEPVPPPLPPAASLRPEWQSAIDRALRNGLAKPAALAELQPPADPQRGAPEARAQSLAPAGVIVETTRPRFEWTPVRGASYVVSVLNENLDVFLESTALHAAQWRPEHDLARGRMYQWQVSVRRGESSSIIPAPPAPPALFRVLDADSHEELERARAEHGGDPLLLGVLYAQHGLRDEALRELAKVDSDDGRRLLRSVEAW